MATLVRTILEKPSLANYVQHMNPFSTVTKVDDLKTATVLSLMMEINRLYMG